MQLLIGYPLLDCGITDRSIFIITIHAGLPEGHGDHSAMASAFIIKRLWVKVQDTSVLMIVK